MFEEDVSTSTAMVISASVCTWKAAVSRRTWGDLRFVVLLFVGLKSTWDAVFPSLSSGP